MASSPFSKRTFLILPAVLLTVSLVEDVLAYKVRQHVPDRYLRTAIFVALYGAGFAVAAQWVTPLLQRAFTTARHSSRREGGALGLWIFYGAAYGALYYAYLIVDSKGPAGLLPPWLR
jgi:hypothetical protein